MDGGAAQPVREDGRGGSPGVPAGGLQRLSSDQQAEALRDAKDVWRRGSTARVASSWRGQRGGLPDQSCPGLVTPGATTATTRVGATHQQGEADHRGQQVDQLWGTFLRWEDHRQEQSSSHRTHGSPLPARS